jgi:hypothetical protein
MAGANGTMDVKV